MGDPLSAFALAGNVLQFVECGTKLVASAISYYRSSNGQPREHEELGNVATVWALSVKSG